MFNDFSCEAVKAFKEFELVATSDVSIKFIDFFDFIIGESEIEDGEIFLLVVETSGFWDDDVSFG